MSLEAAVFETQNTRPASSKMALGDRMKLYESTYDRRFMPLLPVIARVDGRTFHSFTRGLKRPYDEDFMSAMESTALYLARETNALMAYTQSDEITLAWYSDNPKSQIWFDGRESKMVSQLAAHATLWFYKCIVSVLPGYACRRPTFDARAWQVPNLAEGANVFLWREQDATKNSISGAAQSVYSPRELHGKHTGEQQEMLWRKGINWNDYPARFKRGQYIQRKTVKRPFTTEELEWLPERHAARLNPNLEVERSDWQRLSMPPLASVVNREGVIFRGESPVVAPSVSNGSDSDTASYKPKS